MSKCNDLQKKLRLIRGCAGWSAKEFGEKIGVTRQTINNLEADPQRATLSKTQYLAIRYVLQEEIARRAKCSEIIQDILEVFVDHSKECTPEEKAQLLMKAKLFSAVASPQRSAAALSTSERTKLLAGITAAGVIGSVGSLIVDLIDPQK